MARQRDAGARRGRQVSPSSHPSSPVSPSSHPSSPVSPNGAKATRPDEDTAALRELRAQIEETRRELNARLDALTALIDKLLPPILTPAPTPPAEREPSKPIRDFRPGDEVYVPRLGGAYTVVEGSTPAGTFKVQAGGVRVELRVDEAWTLDDTAEERRKRAKTASEPARSVPALDPSIPSIDLHGYSEQDALITLELFLHHAYAQRITRVRVIHGKGNGILREAVRRELKRSALVRSVDMGPHFHGDDGVTLADLDL